MTEETTGSDSTPVSERVLPNVTICHVRPIGTITDFANCLVERPVECPHVLYFGEGNICRNPLWRQFMDRKKSGADGETV